MRTILVLSILIVLLLRSAKNQQRMENYHEPELDILQEHEGNYEEYQYVDGYGTDQL